MNKSKTAILVDSGCDISQEIIEQYDIKVIRLKIMYHEGVYEDGLIDPLTVYDRFKDEVPKTSTPNMHEILEIVDEIRKEGYENIIGITISSGLSGTHNVMASAFQETTDLKTFAFDTKNISIGAGVFAIWAAKQLDEGKNFEEVTAGLERKIGDCWLCYYMDTLTYLRKGGRITPSVALVGKVLNLKPIIACNKEGVYYTVAKIRGAAKGMQKLLNETITPDLQADKCWIMLMNGKGVEAAEAAKKMILERLPGANIIVEGQITATMAIHTGPGLLGIGVFKLD